MFVLVIADLVNAPAKFKKSEVKKILEKLDKCYNTENDPRSDEYKKRRLEQFQTLTDYEARHLVNTFLFLNYYYSIRFFLALIYIAINNLEIDTKKILFL